MTIYAFRAGDPDDERIAALVARSLRDGFARFGWSYVESADLRKLKERIEREGWDTLSEDERWCYQGFLLEIEPGDFVVYVNVPTRGRCTAARVASGTPPYAWLEDRDGIGDFRHAVRVAPDSIVEFDRNDAMAHPTLRARLKLRGRYWRVYAEAEFASLYEQLRAGGGGEALAINHFRDEAEALFRELSTVIHRTHPNFDLEALLAEAFAQLPGVHVERKRGRADLGADLVLTIDAGLPIEGLARQETCLVQVKSHTGSEWSLEALDDLERAFKAYPEATMGLVATTAASLDPAFEVGLAALSGRLADKQVAVLHGAKLAEFVVRNSRGLFS